MVPHWSSQEHAQGREVGAEPIHPLVPAFHSCSLKNSVCACACARVHMRVCLSVCLREDTFPKTEANP